MMKTILILSSLLVGMVSFAAQTSQTHLEKYRIPTICTVTTIMGNIKMQVTGPDCRSLINKAPLKFSNPDPLAGDGSGTLFGPANDPLIQYLLP